MTATTTTRRLTADRWQSRAAAHRARIHAVLGDYLARRAAGEAEPVVDFLFTYYRPRPAQLLRWHPGFGVVLTGTDGQLGDYLGHRGYTRCGDGVTADPRFLTRRRDTIAAIGRLLTATAARPPQLSCFGLHEWAMLYRGGEVRHPGVPLRLGRAGTDAVVDALDLRCTHYDAFRFFSPAAAPRNRTALRRADQVDHEQPGCLHAAMDLYKHCAHLAPLIDSALTADCFALAHTARVLDMRASPYDLRAFGYRPVPVETAAGRAEYVRGQTEIAERAAVLRARLLEHCRRLDDTPA